MSDSSSTNKSKRWTKSWLTHIPPEIRTKIYELCFANGLTLHCITNPPRHSPCLANESPEKASDTETPCSGAARSNTSPSGRARTLSCLLRTCRAVNREVSQHCLFLFSRQTGFLRAASCVNRAVIWSQGDLRLVDPSSKRDHVLDSAPQELCDESIVNVPEWRIDLLSSLASEIIRVRGVYGSGRSVISQRLHLEYITEDDFSGLTDVQVFVFEMTLVPKEDQWFGLADLVKCARAVETISQMLRLGAGRSAGCWVTEEPGFYAKLGARNNEILVVAGEDEWEVVGWKEAALEDRR